MSKVRFFLTLSPSCKFWIRVFPYSTESSLIRGRTLPSAVLVQRQAVRLVHSIKTYNYLKEYLYAHGYKNACVLNL